MPETKHETLSGAAQSTMHGAAYGASLHGAAPKDVGGEETQPGQTEVVAGTVEHQQVLKAYPNATSYAGDVNVVLPPEEEPPPPETLSGAMGSNTLSHTEGQRDTKHDARQDTKTSPNKSSREA